MRYTLAWNGNETYEQRQSILDADYRAAERLARAHIAAGTEMTQEEIANEHARALFAASRGNANWMNRTASPLTIKQVKANDAMAARIKNEGRVLRKIQVLFS
jgi:hypothetical protein